MREIQIIIILFYILLTGCINQNEKKKVNLELNDNTHISIIDSSLAENNQNTIGKNKSSSSPDNREKYNERIHTKYLNVNGEDVKIFETKIYSGAHDGLDKYFIINNEKHELNDTISFFDFFEMSKGEWTFILHAPYAMSESQYKRKINDTAYFDESMRRLTYGFYDINLKTFYAQLKGKQLIEESKKIKVVLSGGDMTTAYLHLYLVRNDTIVFQTGLFAGSTEGFQNQYLGWTEISKKNTLIDFLKAFKPIDKDNITVFNKMHMQ